VPLLVTDDRRRLVDLNPAAAELIGVSHDDALELYIDDLLQDEPVEALWEAFLRVGAMEAEATLRRPDGGERTIEFVATADVRPGRHIAVVRDLTRTKELETQLRQAQKMEAVGHLTGGIAHDFNNLLTGISGNLELLEARLADGRIADARRFVSGAMSGTARAAALTHRLLAFARRQPLDPEPLDTNRLITSMDDLLRRTLGPSIELEMMLKDELWATLCDHNQLENAILNLAINARDAMPDGGRLIVETGNVQIDAAYARSQGGEVDAGDYVTVSVTDNGCGMPPQIVAKVFEPFFTTKPLGRGTGLGLSMLYGFVKQSGGHVRVYSEVGEGTTVRLYLPRYGRDQNGDTPIHVPSVAQKRQRRAEAGETILVIEDEEPIRALINEALTGLGYAVIEAPDGPSGLRILESDDRIDLLVTDVGLPGGLNGRQVADAARERRSDLKFLFITGFAYSFALARGSALDPGMEIMTKPFTLDAFASKVGEMVPRRIM
jgi:PAS domain S-box-containing protein